MPNLPIIKQLILVLHQVLVALHDLFASMGLGSSWTWGLAIIGLTIMVRTILFPLTWRQFSSTQALQAIQPKLQELQRKYKNNREKLNEETMKLYQEHRVNPFASCLPVLLQLPVFFALYYAIRGTSYLDPETTRSLGDAAFLWIPHLGNPDPYFILLIIYVVTQFISTELTLSPTTEKSQKIMMRSMPIFFVFFLFRFPAGLFVYWVTTNIWTIGQQIIIRRSARAEEAEKSSGKPAKPAKRSRFLEMLAEAQEQQKEAGEAGAGAQPQRKKPAGAQQQRKKPAGGSQQQRKKPAGGAQQQRKKSAGGQPQQRKKPAGAQQSQRKATPGGQRKPAARSPKGDAKPPAAGAKPGAQSGGNKPEGASSKDASE